MDDNNTFEVLGRTFAVSEPTFRQLDQLKSHLGFDIASGMKEEQSAELMNDMKKVAGVLAILAVETTPSSAGGLSVPAPPDIKELTDFFYENGTITMFRKTLGFFTLSLKTASADTSGNYLRKGKAESQKSGK